MTRAASRPPILPVMSYEVMKILNGELANRHGTDHVAVGVGVFVIVGVGVTVGVLVAVTVGVTVEVLVGVTGGV